ncbi:MAG: SMP-30/gluconolactonase/LRE family protein [Actinomycetota bacterium]
MVETLPATFEVLDERFARVGGDARLERLYSDCRWAEGPAYFAAGRYLSWSDIPNDRILRWDEITGAVGVFRSPAGYPNGHTIDHEGRLVSCEHGTRRVTRTELDGSVSVLVDQFHGKRLNSPNDVVVRRDGTIWFTDPSYGIHSDYEGFAADREQDGCHVYRFDPADGSCVSVTDDFKMPNGLAFSLDESQLYVVDSDKSEENMRVFDVTAESSLTGGRLFASCTAGTFDGIRLDNQGRIWASAGDGVHCFDPDGTLIGKILVPEVVSNLVFGGLKRNVLFMTATTSVYSIMLKVTGAPLLFA